MKLIKLTLKVILNKHQYLHLWLNSVRNRWETLVWNCLTLRSGLCRLYNSLKLQPNWPCKCFDSCGQSWVRSLNCSQTAEVSAEGLPLAVDERCWSAPVKCSPRTNIEGRQCGAKQKCQQSKRSQNSLFSFSAFHPTQFQQRLIVGLLLKTDPAKWVSTNQNSQLLAGSSIPQWMDTGTSAVIDLRPLFTTFRVHSVSLSLRWHALCPAATCYQRACQPWAHTVDPCRCPQVDTGVEEADQAELRRRQKEKKKNERSRWPWPLCLGWCSIHMLSASVLWLFSELSQNR